MYCRSILLCFSIGFVDSQLYIESNDKHLSCQTNERGRENGRSLPGNRRDSGRHSKPIDSIERDRSKERSQKPPLERPERLSERLPERLSERLPERLPERPEQSEQQKAVEAEKTTPRRMDDASCFPLVRKPDLLCD